jgi:hypothetical protein
MELLLSGKERHLEDWRLRVNGDTFYRKWLIIPLVNVASLNDFIKLSKSKGKFIPVL